MAKGMQKKRIDKNEAMRKGGPLGEEGDRISAGVWGQLAPLDRIAREKTARWGDTLPSLVAPDLAGRFEAAYYALRVFVEANDVMKVNEIAGQLMRAWDVLEKAAMDAGHKPLPPHAYCVDTGDGIVCFAMNGAPEIRRAHPDWAVYSFEDAACVLKRDFSENFLKEAFAAFPEAKVTKVISSADYVNLDLGGDDIPF